MVIKVSTEKCLGVANCGQCLHICPTGVFMNVPVGKYVPHNPPKEYKIVPYFQDVCNKCGACKTVCPRGCIEL